MPIITLCTDFGYDDSYIATMKGVILTINPEATIIDITHNISRHNIAVAAFVVNSYYKYFPKGTIHTVVVDPGVGGRRRDIVLKTKNYIFIGPDNGVFSYILADQAFECYEIKMIHGVSKTFHGRDVFAPASAKLSLKWDRSIIGKRIDNPEKIEIPKPIIKANVITGEVVYIDHFGNLITNIPVEILLKQYDIEDRSITISVKGVKIKGISETYEQCKDNLPCAIINSFNLLEIALNKDSACEKLDVKVGDRVRVYGNRKENN